jgi:hypothetical protein
MGEVSDGGMKADEAKLEAVRGTRLVVRKSRGYRLC